MHAPPADLVFVQTRFVGRRRETCLLLEVMTSQPNTLEAGDALPKDELLRFVGDVLWALNVWKCCEALLIVSVFSLITSKFQEEFGHLRNCLYFKIYRHFYL